MKPHNTFRTGDGHHWTIRKAARILGKKSQWTKSPVHQKAARDQMAKFHASLVEWHSKLGGAAEVDRLLIERFNQDHKKVAALRHRWGWRRPALLLRRLIKEERQRKALE